MNRLRSPLFILGLLLSAAVVVALLLAGRLMNPPAVEIPVAIRDLPAGAALESADFRLEQWRGLSDRSLAEYVSADEFLERYQGALLLEPVHSGFPVAKAQLLVDGAPDPQVDHLALAVTDPNQALFALPVSPDTAGNYIQPGDTVDVIFSIGGISAQEIENPPPPTPTAPPLGGWVPTPQPTPIVTETLRLPLTKLVLQNVPVLAVERDQPAEQQSVTIPGQEAEPPPEESLGDVQRLYVALDRAQLEVVSFLLHNGDVRYAVRAAASSEELTDGITWDDFVEWFFDQRPGAGADAAPPEEPADAAATALPALPGEPAPSATATP